MKLDIEVEEYLQEISTSTTVIPTTEAQVTNSSEEYQYGDEDDEETR